MQGVQHGYKRDDWFQELDQWAETLRQSDMWKQHCTDGEVDALWETINTKLMLVALKVYSSAEEKSQDTRQSM